MAWEFEAVARLLDEFVGPIEGNDPKARKRARILRTATELFARQGYRKTSIDEIAAAAGVAKGTIYLYFPAKIDLVVAASALEKRGQLERFRPILDCTIPARDRLRMYLRMLFSVVSDMPLTARLLRGDQELAAVMAEMPPEIRAQNLASQDEFLGELVKGAVAPRRLSPLELKERVAIVFGLALASGRFLDDDARSGLSLERFAEVLADTVIDGLATTTPPPDPGDKP